MTLARDPKQFFVSAPGGGTTEEESWRSTEDSGIIGEEPLWRNTGGGTVEEDHTGKQPGGNQEVPSTQETSRRHPP